MPLENQEFLLSICDGIYRAQERAAEEYRREKPGDSISIELFVMRRDKVRVEIRKENVNHNEPHLHITHSDIINASLSLKDFRVLAGNIDSKTKRHLLDLLTPVQPKLMAIWTTLNEKDNSVGAEKLISNLFSNNA